MIDEEDKLTIDMVDYINNQKGQVVGYIRVSSESQNTDRQLDGINLDKTFIEKISGSKKNRPELNRLIEYVRDGDTVVVHSLDRLARDLSNLISIVEMLNKKGVTLKSLKENLTFNGSNNSLDKFLLHILGAVAEFQRALLKEAQKEGIRKAKQKGMYKGRKPALTPAQVEELKEIAQQKYTSLESWKKTSWQDVADKFNVSRKTIFNYLQKIDKEVME